MNEKEEIVEEKIKKKGKERKKINVRRGGEEEGLQEKNVLVLQREIPSETYIHTWKKRDTQGRKKANKQSEYDDTHHRNTSSLTDKNIQGYETYVIRTNNKTHQETIHIHYHSSAVYYLLDRLKINLWRKVPL